ncbi:MAG: putative transcriptional regulator [Cognaticolwellia sp.]
MSDAHLLSDELLLAYATGESSEAMSLFAAAHLCLNPAARAVLRRLEAGLAAGLESAPTALLEQDAFAKLLGRLDETPAAPMVPTQPALETEFEIPEPLWPYLQDLDWRSVVPGRVKQVELELKEGQTPLALVWMRPGFRVPVHSHHGPEFNLVLSGGFTDLDQDFLPGDVAQRGPEHEHDMQVHKDGPCVVLVMRDGPLIPRSAVAHLASWFTGF